MKRFKFEMTSSEEEVMEYIWERGRVTFRDILEYFHGEKGKTWKKQTLNTYLSRLIEKGLLETDGDTRKIYSPAISREAYEQKKAKSIISTFYGGRMYNFLSAFCGNEKMKTEEIEEIEKLIKLKKKEVKSLK